MRPKNQLYDEEREKKRKSKSREKRIIRKYKASDGSCDGMVDGTPLFPLTASSFSFTNK